MFEGITEQVQAILTYSIGGVTISALLGLIVYAIAQLRTVVKEAKLNKTQISTAFKDAILPKTLKLDVSSKIEKPIQDGINKLSTILSEKLEKISKGEVLMLSILKQFSHVKQLPEELQQQINEYLDDSEAEEVSL